jgi:hypothetical protein
MTRRQSQLIKELDQITSLLGLDYAKFDNMSNEERTGRLLVAKSHLIKSEVLMKYVLFDELLNDILSWHYFGRKRSFIRLWKTKKFKGFNYYVLEKLYLVQKLEHVQFIHKLPNFVTKDLYSLNGLRNAIAHSFFPENRRVKPLWKSKDLFSLEGFESFLDDMQQITDFLLGRFWKVPKWKRIEKL